MISICIVLCFPNFISIFYLRTNDGFSSNAGEKRLYYEMANSSPSSSFHIIANPSSSLSLIVVSLHFFMINLFSWIHVIYAHEFELLFIKFCRIKFGCEWCSTNPKILQALIRRKILQSVFWQKWIATSQYGIWWQATYIPSTLSPHYDVKWIEKS